MDSPVDAVWVVVMPRHISLGTMRPEMQGFDHGGGVEHGRFQVLSFNVRIQDK